MPTSRGAPGVTLMRRARAGVVSALAGLLAVGCSVGTGTLRIADAEAQIVTVAEEVVRAAGLTLATPVRAAPLEQCELRSGGSGFRTRVEVRGALATGTGSLADAFDASAVVLVAHDLVIVESGVPGTLLGQRDGLTVTIGSDGRTLELDALTGCRPR
jgi:hypothetical protein